MTLDFASVLPDASRIQKTEVSNDTTSGDSHKRGPESTLKLLFTPTERKKRRGAAFLAYSQRAGRGRGRS